MRLATTLLPFLFAAVTQAHSLFQKVSINGVDQGSLKGVRVPGGSFANYPVQNVNDTNISCNTNIAYKDSNILDIPAGAQVGAFWGHILGGPQIPNDPDNPIAPSHKGPVIVYLAKVDDAATTGTTGLSWFKISEDGLDGNGKWGVDRMIANGGWSYFSIPSCLAPGNYLMRVEIIALHSAYAAGGAQFYMECAQINVTGSGTKSPTSFVGLPGAYVSNDPGILINIYGPTGVPDNAGKPYAIPGPALFTC